MHANTLNTRFVLSLVAVQCALARQRRCDTSTGTVVPSGNLGESGVFCWLGVLRVHLHDGDSSKIALTGVVLIKENYVLANADDIARIPPRVFTQESQIMFIPQNATPWYCRPRSYVTHPEYEYSTYNTIAVVELALDDARTHPLTPICLPTTTLNTSSHLYVAGYTDDNKFLEKVIYKVQYLEKSTCENFYKKAGLSAERRAPLHYRCGFAGGQRDSCVWDNGMALISNASGRVALIGLGVRGPGCAAPARFIDTQHYLQWLEAATTLAEVDEYGDYRRAHEPARVHYVPAHELLRSGNKDVALGGVTWHNKTPSGLRSQFFTIDQTEENAYLITPFNTKYERTNGSCDEGNDLVYREQFKIQINPHSKGGATYKLSLYDFEAQNISCVKLTVNSRDGADAVLYYTEVMDFGELTGMAESGEVPEELLKYYPITERTVNTTTRMPGTGRFFRPEYIKSSLKILKTPTVNLILKLEIDGEATLNFEMFNSHERVTTKRPPLERARNNRRTFESNNSIFTKRFDGDNNSRHVKETTDIENRILEMNANKCSHNGMLSHMLGVFIGVIHYLYYRTARP